MKTKRLVKLAPPPAPNTNAGTQIGIERAMVVFTSHAGAEEYKEIQLSEAIFICFQSSQKIKKRFSYRSKYAIYVLIPNCHNAYFKRAKMFCLAVNV